ncbi:MAG: hypothetical protein ACR652_21260 [Methylocystis sp.]|uniref:hypothetical protein n=1 Tax=Methylocystis sp. TaxID=1911079 RepID=UPI003DA458C6
MTEWMSSGTPSVQDSGVNIEKGIFVLFMLLGSHDWPIGDKLPKAPIVSLIERSTSTLWQIV